MGKSLLFTLVVLLLAGVASAITAGDVETAVETDLGIGATTTYLDFTNSSTGYAREGLTMSQSASGDDWGYPDGSNTVMMVNADSLDDKFNTASDFEITITGLDANTNYGVYCCVKGRPTSSSTGDFSWGYDSDGAAINDLNNIANQVGAVQLAGDAGDYMYAVPLSGIFTSDGTGTLKMWVGCATLYNTSANEAVRTQLDGVVIAPPPKNAWSPLPVDGGIGVSLDSTLSWSAGDSAISHDVYFGIDETAVANAQRLAGDVNGDGTVDIEDLQELASQWLTTPGAVNPSADIAFSGKVDIEDFVVLANDWGQSSTPEFKGNRISTTYDPGTLAYSTTYYWRIDEVNGSYPDSPWAGIVWSFTTASPPVNPGQIVFPGTTWDTKTPEELGLDGAKLDQLAANIGGNGIIVRQGYVVKTWGSQTSKADWASACKPVISTMLFYAVEEGLLSDVHELIGDHGWTMSTKDQSMEFYHLANMISGYARGEAPGAAWAYNDYAINLYAKTLFDNVYGTTANTAATDASRLGALGFQDGSIFGSRGGYGIETSVRDFARIGWLWCNKGYWDGVQLLPQSYFDDYMKAHVPSSTPRTTISGTDYLSVGTIGGGSDQTANGPGVYGFNWWCNDNVVNWPDAPADTIQANGHWGLEVVTVIPSLSVVVATYGGNMGDHNTGSSTSTMNQNLKLLTDACPPPASTGFIQVDPTNPARMVYSDIYVNGHLKPVCFAGPGDPEDFFYNDTANNISLLTSRPARCTYITAVLQDFGGGNPGTGTALDAKLDDWESYITELENAGVITVFFFFDDSQPLTSNWEELVDKCVAKFKHHRLLIWSVAEEYAEALTSAQVSAVAARIKSQDDNNHVVGVHKNDGNSFSEFLSDPNIDMYLMQRNLTSASGLHDAVKTSNANGTKIINLAEVADHASQTQTTVRQWNWAAIMGGASAVQVLWMGRYSDPADWNAQGKYDDCARLMDFMESTNLNVTSNRDDLARGETDYVLADPGNVYIAYGDVVTASLGVNVVAGDYKVKWFDPIDGDWVDQGVQTLSAGDQYLSKPAAIGTEAALYLEAVIVVVPTDILPNDDCAVRNGVNYNAYININGNGELGLLVKNSTDISWIEFTLGNDPVNQATLTIYQDDGGVDNLWTILVKGAEFDFDETTFTGTDASSWTSIGSMPNVKAIAPSSMDMTSFYNDNLGKTVTLQLYRADPQPAGNGPVFQDRELTRQYPWSGNSFSPKISIQ